MAKQSAVTARPVLRYRCNTKSHLTRSTVNLRMGQTVIAVGTLTKPSDLAALDMRLKVSGKSMGRLYALSGVVVLPETPPFVTEGHLIGTLSPQESCWIYEKFSGKVGSSDITGSLKYQSGVKDIKER